MLKLISPIKTLIYFKFTSPSTFSCEYIVFLLLSFTNQIFQSFIFFMFGKQFKIMVKNSGFVVFSTSGPGENKEGHESPALPLKQYEKPRKKFFSMRRGSSGVYTRKP